MKFFVKLFPLLITISSFYFVTQAQTTTQNYVRTRTPRVPIATNTTLDSYTSNKDKVSVSIQYIDGLGNPLQTVQQQGSPGGNDIIEPFAIDQLGREPIKYLPYTVTSATPGAYQPTALDGGSGYISSAQYQFYQQTGQGYITNQYPSASTAFESSPLNRVLEQGAPGAPWQLTTSGVSGSGNTVKVAYTTNNQAAFVTTTLTNNPGSQMVALYTATVNADQSRTLVRTNNTATYGIDQLDVTISMDENWNPATDGCLGTTETYTDKQGRTILKRTYNQLGSVLQMLSTYYVYDDLGELAFVLPPASNPDANAAISQAKLDNICYQYRYDERRRPSKKKIPGKGWEYMVYNYIGQLVASQDANQLANNQWLFTKYDGAGRPVMTGIWTNGGTAITRDDLQNQLTAITTNLWEAPTNSGNGYTTVAWPTNPTTVLTINYYDSYNSIPNFPTGYALPTNATNNQVRGLLTASLTAVLNNPTDMLWTVNYYDAFGRAVKTYKQHYLGGIVNANNYDAISTTYNFTNAPTTVKRQHFNTANTTVALVNITDTYYYDHMGRKLSDWVQIINSGTSTTKTLISKIDYNELGQVLNKNLHSTDSANYLQKVAYTYNERGWLLTSSAQLFAMQLQYNTATKPQYNGNIGGQYWGTPGNLNFHYTYAYDRLNRITAGNSLNGNNENAIGYDLNGNITLLKRYQTTTLIDNFTYTYNGTNQLQKLRDTLSSDLGVKQGTYTYTYDANGNLLTDPAKVTGPTSFTYNLLNLPSLVTQTNGTVAYTYSATGEKLRKVTTINANGLITATDYISGIQYKLNATTIDFIQTEEGKAVLNTAGTAYDYFYYLGDNLGNTRVTFDSQGGGTTPFQTDDYYPFGLEISRIIPSVKNEYLYNKKELQEEFAEYDYGARFYDPVVARWNTIDPLAEKYPALSTYNYVANNPILNIDAQGDSIIVTSSSPNTVNIRVTGKMINDSSHPYTQDQMNAFVSRTSNAIKQYYGGASDDNFHVNVTTDITVESKENPLAAGDHAFRITDAGEIPDITAPGTGIPDINAVGLAPLGENVVYLSTALLNQQPAVDGPYKGTGLSSTGEATLERTAAHELGHSGGMAFGDDVHPAKGTMPGNLMNRTNSGEAGTKVTKGEVLQMLKNYNDGKLNKGQQKVE